ncbi:MAG: hypothetical protein RL444_268 [Verrucomicrobiota bacterium]|jgi:hypothetical protein
MHRFKKNLGFNLGLIGLGAAFLAGLVMAYLAYSGGEETSRALRATTTTEVGLLKGHSFAPGEEPVSLNEDNVKAAQADVADLVAHRDKLRSLIAGNPEMAIRGKASANSAELSALLRESVDGWRKLATDQGVKFSPNEPTSFGFHRYIHNQGTSPKRDFQKVDQQRLIIDYLVRQLVESRPAGSPLLIESVDREPIETFVLIPEGRPGAGTFGPDAEASRNEVDEFAPVRTLSRPGLVEALSFRVRFVGYTPTLRTFVNKIRNSGRPFAVTTIDVGTTTKETEKLLASPASLVPSAGPAPAVTGTPTLSFFDQAPADSAAPAGNAAVSAEEKRVQVVQRKLSTFVVQIDYLSIPEEKPAAGAEGEPKK